VTLRTTFFVFADGSLVGWNASWDEMVWMRGLLASSSPSQPLDHPPTTPGGSRSLVSSSPPTIAVESMRYQLFLTLPMSERPQDSEPQEVQTYIDADHDRIILADDDDINTKLPYSYALVQSVKLDAMNASLEPVARVVKHWQQQLSVDGRLLCTLKNLRQVKTNLLGLNEALNFGHMMATQTTPRIFWSGEFHSARGYYREACDHLEIDDRASNLKGQMESIDETLSYLHDEAHATENEWLTRVIIGLIMFEVLAALGVFDLVAGWIIDACSSRSNHTTASTIAANGDATERP
jgi:uncharacterized Rmd1/YagE family protein